MPIRFRCSQCHALMQVADAAAGHKTQCPSCKIILPVPSEMGAVKGVEATGITPETPGAHAGIQTVPESQNASEIPQSALGIQCVPETKPPHENTLEPAPMSGQSVHVRCLQCGQLMRATEGTTVNCPHCKGEFEVPMAGGAGGYGGFPKSAATFFRVEQGQRGKVEGVNIPTFSNPYAVTASLGDSSRTGYAIPGGRENDAWQYTVNGIVFMVVGLFYLVSFVGAIVQLIFAFTFDTQPNAERVALIPAIFGFVLTLPISVVYLLGGLSMVRQKSLGMARAVAILATIPPLNLCVLFPFGIWATVLTFSGRARNDFR